MVASLKLRNIITHNIKVASYCDCDLLREAMTIQQIDYFHGDLFMKKKVKEWKCLASSLKKDLTISLTHCDNMVLN